MGRLIDADVLIEEFEWLKGVVNKYKRPHIEETIERIDNAPTVDAVPVVHGLWENIIDFGGGKCYGSCSVCGTAQITSSVVSLKAFHKYCYWCGAKMDGKEER